MMVYLWIKKICLEEAFELSNFQNWFCLQDRPVQDISHDQEYMRNAKMIINSFGILNLKIKYWTTKMKWGTTRRNHNRRKRGSIENRWRWQHGIRANQENEEGRNEMIKGNLWWTFETINRGPSGLWILDSNMLIINML